MNDGADIKEGCGFSSAEFALHSGGSRVNRRGCHSAVSLPGNCIVDARQ
jgi:hypothetical protein